MLVEKSCHYLVSCELAVQHGSVVRVYVLLVGTYYGQGIGANSVNVGLHLVLRQVAHAQHLINLLLGGLGAAHVRLELCKGWIAGSAYAGREVVFCSLCVPGSGCW